MASTWRRVATALVALAVLATACGGDEDVAEDQTSEASAAPSDELVTSVTIGARGTAQQGGRLAFGIEAETSGFDPYLDRFAPAGLLMAYAVYDPLAAFDDAGVAQPYLARTFDHNDDYTLWTIGLRDGVTFQDGSPVDAQAIATHLNRVRDSFLTQAAARPLQEATVVDPLTVEVSMSMPWVAFPVALVGQGGVVPAPSVAEGALSATPVGSGPFTIQERVVDDHTLMVRNDAYWQDGLPYLDEVDFRVLPLVEDRVAALKAGEVDLIHTTNEVLNAQLLEDARAGTLQYVRDTGEQEELFVMFNTAEPPFDDVRLRRAAAYAIDLDTFLQLSGKGYSQRADGVFDPESPWYAETEFPRDDPEQARTLVAEHEAERGPATVTLNCSNSQDSLTLCQELADRWAEVGIDTSVQGIEQDQLINSSIAGRYQVVLWRQFGSPDPDGDYQWWIGPQEGQTTLNFARIKDDELDAALNDGRSKPDVADRKDAYRRVQERFAELVPYVWLERIGWVIVADTDVRDFRNMALPDGGTSAPYVNGVFRLTATWIER